MEHDAGQRQSRNCSYCARPCIAGGILRAVGAGHGTFKSAREGCSEAVEPVPGAADAMLYREKLQQRRLSCSVEYGGVSELLCSPP